MCQGDKTQEHTDTLGIYYSFTITWKYFLEFSELQSLLYNQSDKSTCSLEVLVDMWNTAAKLFVKELTVRT